MSLREIEVPLDPELDFLAGQMVTVRFTTRLDDLGDLAILHEHNTEYIFIGFIKNRDEWTPYFCAARYHPELEKALAMQGISVESFIKAQAFYSAGTQKISMMTVYPESFVDEKGMRQMLRSCFDVISPDFLIRSSIYIYDEGDSRIAEYDPIKNELFMTISP
ncbi:MAG: hypothetical protein AAB557_05290 [Patescibacteria group bacterium]